MENGNKTKGASASGDPKGKVRSLRARVKGKRVVKGGTRMSNKPDYEGTNFRNKAIDRISGQGQLMRTIQPMPRRQLMRTIQPMGAVGKGGSRNR